MSIKRKLIRIDTPKAEPGFLGPDHTARAVITGGFAASDPFIMLMDDYLDKKDDTPVGALIRMPVLKPFLCCWKAR